MIDIVFPNNNELDFIRLAEKLGYSALCFVYERDQDISVFTKQTSLKLFKATTPGKDKKGFLVARSSEKDRYLIESRSVGMISDFELLQRSQLNHILANLASEKDVLVGFSFSTMLNSGNRDKIIGKMSQHIVLCRKYKAKMVIGSFANDPYELRNPQDLMSFYITVGMLPSEAKQALLNLRERLERLKQA